ncbi:MAG: ABC transporter ATP-binding protein [Candidatus Latescibacterota bacterium]
MNPPAIRTEHLIRDFKTVRAVDSVSLEVPQGAIFGFLGPNGAGKTTMIRLLLGILEPTGGQAETLGFDIRSQGERIREQTGALLEHTGLYERLTAEQNLEFYGRVWRIPHPDRRTRIRELLTRFGLWDRRGERVGEWSRGMKQKLAVARAILHRPALLFLDEPTAGLDPVASTALRDDLGHLARKEGITIFLTTHNLVEAEKLCSLVGVISRGKLLTVGHPDALRARTGGTRVEIFGSGFTAAILSRLQALPEVKSAEMENGRLDLTLSANAPAAPVVSFLVRQGAAIEEVRKGAASLEEAFLTLLEEEEIS